jgi:hypothetical protein
VCSVSIPTRQLLIWLKKASTLLDDPLLLYCKYDFGDLVFHRLGVSCTTPKTPCILGSPPSEHETNMA